MSTVKRPFLWFILALLTTAGLTAVGPQEKSLGPNVRIIYLHGAWALTAEAAFCIAAVVGALALLTRRENLHRWSASLGYSGLFFWLTYLPLSLWAMQANWNGLFLAEPRFRLAVTFSVVGVLLQVGLLLLGRHFLISLFNLLFFIALEFGLSRAGYVMHPPPSPIFSSGILSLQLFFIGVTFLTITAAYFMALWWRQRIR